MKRLAIAATPVVALFVSTFAGEVPTVGAVPQPTPTPTFTTCLRAHRILTARWRLSLHRNESTFSDSRNPNQ